mgnify:CR=1 FL=1
MPKGMRRQLAMILLVTSIIIAAAGVAVIAYAEGPGHEEVPGTAEETAVASLNKGLVALSAGIAVASSTIASAIALRSVASAGFAASVERPELTSYLLILSGLAEGIAIYGLLVAILLLGKI